MEDNEKKQRLIEVEYCLRRYFTDNLAPILDEEARHQREMQEKETVSRKSSLSDVYTDAASPFVMQPRPSGEWNQKNSDDLIRATESRFYGKDSVRQDMAVMAKEWKDAYIAAYGEQRYKDLSSQSEYGDLAVEYVWGRMKGMEIERLAKARTPRNTLEYIMRTGVNESLPGIMAYMSNKGKMGVADFDIETLADRGYKASFGEKAAAQTVAFLLDGGASSTLAAGIDIGTRLVFSTFHSSSTDAEELSEKVFDDKDFARRLNEDSRKVQASESKTADDLNARLENKFRMAVNQHNMKSYSGQFTAMSDGNGADSLALMKDSLVQARLAYLPNKKVPDWMMKKCSEDVCIKNAGYYLGIALEMQSKGKTSIRIGSKQMTLQQVTQQAYDYARAADRKAQDRPRTPKDALEERISENEAYLNAVGLIPDDQMDDAEDRQQKETVPDSHILQQVTSALHKHGMAYLPESRWPSWMDRMDEETLATNAKRFRNIAIQMQSARKDTVSVNGQQMTLQEVSQRAYDYARASDAKYKEAQAKSRLEEEEERRWNENMAAIEEGNRMPEPKATEAKDDTRTRYAVQITTGDQQGETQDGQQRGRMTKGNSAPWKGWLDTLGLGGLSDLTANLGETIAMLPEMLVGMFTGKIKGFSMKDNMMPLALIFGGLLFGKRNPLLRLLLMGFGGMLLLNNANKVLTGKGEGQQQQPRATYRRIEDEPLNPRIKNVELKGNTILAEVDGLQTIFTIESERTIDAYNKGVLPLNVMCNAALRKFDESKLTASEHYEHIARNQEQRQEEEEQIRIR